MIQITHLHNKKIQFPHSYSKAYNHIYAEIMWLVEEHLDCVMVYIDNFSEEISIAISSHYRI
jgi:hypothetical protein